MTSLTNYWYIVLINFKNKKPNWKYFNLLWYLQAFTHRTVQPVDLMKVSGGEFSTSPLAAMEPAPPDSKLKKTRALCNFLFSLQWWPVTRSTYGTLWHLWPKSTWLCTEIVNPPFHKRFFSEWILGDDPRPEFLRKSLVKKKQQPNRLYRMNPLEIGI